MSRIADTFADRPPTDHSGEAEVFPARGVSPLGFNISKCLAEIDHSRLRQDRLKRLQVQLVRRDYTAALLLDPINIRYATGARNMAVWTMHAPGRYAFVPAEGRALLYEFGTSKHVSAGLETIGEVRTSTPWFYFLSGPRTAEKTQLWADEIIVLMSHYKHCGKRLAVDRCEPWGARLLMDAGIELFDAQEIVEQARAIKTIDEIQCMQLSMDVCDLAVERLRGALKPGITENQLWAVLHDTNIAHDGEWIECRLLASGERTNPWFQECGNRVIQAGDLVGFDTDMIGPMGYLADISRCYVCPGKRATIKQRQFYELAQEQVLRNAELLRPGISFREFSERCWTVPPEFVPNRYMMMVHGAGMCDEFPIVPYEADFPAIGYDGVFEENMVVCVESYIGEVGGSQGVKLEQQILITGSGSRIMSHSPFIDALEI